MNPSPTSGTGLRHRRAMEHATVKQQLEATRAELERLTPGLPIQTGSYPAVLWFGLKGADDWLKTLNVKVPVTLLRGAVQELGLDDFEDSDQVEVPRVLLAAIAAFIRDGEPFCDHSVGICACSSRGTMEELELASRGLRTCPDCHGDGVDFEKETKCARCNGACHVPLEGTL